MTFQFKDFYPSEPDPSRKERFGGWLVEGIDGVYRPQKRIDCFKQKVINILKTHLLGK